MCRNDERTGENAIGLTKGITTRTRALILISVLIAVISGCSGADATGGLGDLQVVGVDYELNSMVITNAGASDVRTEDLWIYQNGDIVEFNIFTIEPRATILFSLRDVGGAEASGGEVALFSGDSFSDPEAMLDYVAWGASGHEKSPLASEAGLWGPDEYVDVPEGTAGILRADQAAIGADSWIVADDE